MTTTTADDDGTTPAYSSPPCFMHELEPTSVGYGDVRIKRVYDEDERLRELAPSTELRQRAADRPLTLLYSARDRQLNQATVLREVIQES